jgi:uncharacterized protein (TIGR02246 family)
MSERTVSIEARLGALEDERRIERRLAAYAYALDNGDYDALLDCFTEDGVWQTDTGGALRGTRRMREYLDATFEPARAAGRRLQHVTTNHRIVVDGDRAEAESYVTTMTALPDGPAAANFGRYYSELVRGGDGEWRFTLRETRLHARRP